MYKVFNTEDDQGQPLRGRWRSGIECADSSPLILILISYEFFLRICRDTGPLSVCSTWRTRVSSFLIMRTVFSKRKKMLWEVFLLEHKCAQKNNSILPQKILPYLSRVLKLPPKNRLFVPFAKIFCQYNTLNDETAFPTVDLHNWIVVHFHFFPQSDIKGHK